MEELALPPNETSFTLPNLKYSTRYKFYLNAKTVVGAGPAISQEAITIMDEGKSADDWLKVNDLNIIHVSATGTLDEYLGRSMWIMNLTL